MVLTLDSSHFHSVVKSTLPAVMRSTLLGWLVPCLLVTRTMAQIESNTSVAVMLGMIPECALDCVLHDIFEEGGCAPSYAGALAACACTNSTMQSHLSACVQKSCPFKDQTELTVLAAELCAAYPKESRVDELKTVSIVTIALSIPFLFLRLHSRWLHTRKLWIDDAYAIIAAALLVVVSIIILRMSLMGFGLHYWHVPGENAVDLLKLFYVCQMVYIAVQVFAKVSILALYSRLFPDTIRWFQWAVRGMIAFMFTHGLLFFLLVVFQCLPVESIWNKTITGKCLPVTAVIGFLGAGLSIAEDFIILFLPLHQLWELQMDTRKKVGLILLLCVGSFASITSIVRLKYMINYANTYDSTWDNVDVIKWSLIEILSACVCGNLLPLRPLIDKIMSNIKPITSWHSIRSQRTSEKHSVPGHHSKQSVSKKRSIENVHHAPYAQHTQPAWSQEKIWNNSELKSPETPSPTFYRDIESCEILNDYEPSLEVPPTPPEKDTRPASPATSTDTRSQERKSGRGSKKHLEIPPINFQEHRFSGPWSRALALLDRG